MIRMKEGVVESERYKEYKKDQLRAIFWHLDKRNTNKKWIIVGNAIINKNQDNTTKTSH